MIWSRLFVLGAVLTAVAGCGDPYAIKVGAAALTPGEAEKVLAKLPDRDKELFLRWTTRTAKGMTYGGEPTAFNVRDAIRNQQEFELRQADLRAEEERRLAAQRQAAAAEEAAKAKRLAELNLLREHRQAVHAEISKSLSLEGLSHDLRGLFDRSGEVIGYEWAFNLRLTNHTKKQAVGLAGWVTIKDAFGSEMGVFPVRLEMKIAPGTSITMPATMRLSVGDPLFREIRRAQTVFPHWFLESAAFLDGTRIDAGSVPGPTATAVKVTS